MSTMNMMKMAKAMGKIRELQTDFPASSLQCLFIVMMNDGLNQQDVAQRAGIPKSSCSRCLRMLSPRLSPGKDGMGLIDFRQDTNDIRYKVAYLTPKGEALKAELMEILG